MSISNKYFKYNYDYHYYEEEVYSMGHYFEGFNLRQLKRLMFIYNQFALSYQSYLQLIDNKKRENIVITKLENSSLNIYISLYSKVKKIVKFMNGFHETTKNCDKIYPNTFGEFYLKDMHGRCWIKDDEFLRTQKWVRYTTEDGKKWGYGPTEEYFPTDEFHITGINNLNTLFLFGEWLEYFKIASSENTFSNNELNKFNLNIFNELYEEALNLRKNLKKLKYIKK